MAMATKVEDQVWERLFLYENAELLKRFYHQKHGKKLTTTKAKEITSHFAQGREYFGSAAGRPRVWAQIAEHATRARARALAE